MPNTQQKLKKEWISRDAVIAAIQMQDVLDHYEIELKENSKRIHCPFHEDDRPSCSVDLEAKLFNCFACGEQGNVLDFIGEMEGLDPKTQFRDILEVAIEIIGHNPSPQNSKRKAASPKKKRAVAKRSAAKAEADNQETEHQSKTIIQTVEADNQETEEQLEPNPVLEAPAFPLKLDHKHPWLKTRLAKIGMTPKDAERLGIGFETRSNALMAGRVCFPITNVNGQLVAYAGRWAADQEDDQVNEKREFIDAKGRVQERYKLPKQFKKQLELYHFAQTMQQHPQTKTIILVEGFWSALRLAHLKLPVAALMGTAMSHAQMQLLHDANIQNIVLMLDGDAGGRKASAKLLPKLAQHFFVTDMALSDDQKPDTIDKTVLAQMRERFALKPQAIKLKQSKQTNGQLSDLSFGSIGQSYVIDQNNIGSWPT